MISLDNAYTFEEIKAFHERVLKGIGAGEVRTRLFRARRMMARWLTDDD